MIERVASAIAKADFEWQDTPGAQIMGWSETLARAAIKAMRDFPPSQYVSLPVTELDGETENSSFTKGEVQAVWHAMIDAALAGAQAGG
jgi:hypothetical protein